MAIWRMLCVWAAGLLAVIGLSVPASGVILLVPNEKGSSINTLNTATSAVGTYMTGLPNPDGMKFASDGNLYVTSFSNGTLNRITSSTTSVTVASGFNGAGALALSPVDGSFYIPNFGNPSGGGTSVGKVSPIGGGNYSTSVNFATGLSTPDGMAFSSTGQLYEADFGSNRILRIDTTTGAVTQIVPNTAGLSRPAALAFDSSDNLYVSNFGDANGIGGFISKITNLTGTPTVNNTFVTGLSSPLGLLLDQPNSTFYVSSWNGNTVSSFPMAGGTPTLVASGFNGPTHIILAPEPATLGLLAAGGIVLLTRRRQKRNIPAN